jgi:hypothetical protein
MTQHSPAEVLCVPGNPATVSWDTQDVGQWLCVPPFRVVCLSQATLSVCDVLLKTIYRFIRSDTLEIF